MAITRKVNSGIEITKARGDEDVSRCSLTRSKLITVGEMRVTTKASRTQRRLAFFSKPPHEDEGPFLMASFSSTPERWQAPQPLHKLHEGEARASSQSSKKRSPQHQPPSQLGGHPPRVTSSRSLTRTNRNGELNTMQGCKARTPKVFKFVTLKFHQSNKC